MAHDCEILLLGPPGLRCGGERVRPPTARGLALLAYLALQEGPQRREHLATLLWDAPEQIARHRLRQELYRLQHGSLAALLESDRTHVKLKNVDSDAARFLERLERGAWEAALGERRGPFMEGFALDGAEVFEDWLAVEREAWEGRYVLALSRLALEREGAREAGRAVQLWRQVLEVDPYHEEAYRRLLWLLAEGGRWPEAEQLYRNYMQRLETHLGLEPDPETRRLFEQLKARKSPMRPSAAPVPEALSNPPLVGRGERLAELERLAPRAALLIGEAGSGKSRLAHEHMLRLGGRLAVTHPAASRGLPFAGLVGALDQALEILGPPEVDPVWLREAGRLLPHRLPPAERPLQGAADRTRFLEGLGRVVLALAGPVLVWDDLQWTDPAALELLGYLLPLAARTGTQLVLALRTPTEPGPATDWLAPLEGELERLEVTPLDENAVHELILKLAHQPYGARLFSRRLHAATGGNPFFVLETLRHLFARGELQSRPGGWSTPYDRTTRDYHELPLAGSIRSTLWARLRSLDAPLRRSLQLVSLSRQPVAPEVLAHVQGTSELEAARHLEALRAHQLITGQVGGYAPANEHLRALVLEPLEPPLARTYHRAWARALQRERQPAKAAEHWLEAGHEARAARNFLAAARERSSEPLSARALYRRALDLHAGLSREERRAAELDLLELDVQLGRFGDEQLARLRALAREADARAELLLAEALLQRGDYTAARERVLAGLALAQRLDLQAEQARAHFLLAWIHYRHGDPDAQIAELEQALAAFEQLGDRGGMARTLRNLAALHFRIGQKDAGDELQARALATARALGDTVLALRIRADRATGRWLRGEALEVRKEARALRRAAARLGDYGGELDALELEGLAAFTLGDFESAFHAFEAAVRRAVELHLEKDEALARSERALAAIELERYTEAAQDLDTALSLQRRIGDQAKLGHTLHTYGYLHLRQGRPQEAYAWFQRAARHWRRRGERGHLARSLAYAALAAEASGHPDRAKRLSAEALRAARDWSVGVPELPLLQAVYARFHPRGRAQAEAARQALERMRERLPPRARSRFERTLVYRLAFGL